MLPGLGFSFVAVTKDRGWLIWVSDGVYVANEAMGLHARKGQRRLAKQRHKSMGFLRTQPHSRLSRGLGSGVSMGLAVIGKRRRIFRRNAARSHEQSKDDQNAEPHSNSRWLAIQPLTFRGARRRAAYPAKITGLLWRALHLRSDFESAEKRTAAVGSAPVRGSGGCGDPRVIA
jgi:hypothetical protein